jgi:uncharacterized repeat protein (TIGR03803 family)
MTHPWREHDYDLGGSGFSVNAQGFPSNIRSKRSVMLREQFSTHIRNPRCIALLTLILVAAVALPTRAQTYTVLHVFTASPDGAVPNPMIQDAQGNFYGSTRFGGLASCDLDSCGTIFKIDSAGNESILYDFQGGNNGVNPTGSLALDPQGNLWGVTQGNFADGGASVVFKLEPDGQETSYDVNEVTICCLDSPLVADAQGNLFGMSPYGGEPRCAYVQNPDLGCGTLFKVTPEGKFTVLHTFTGTDGIQPEGGLVIDANGNLYGSAFYGGSLKCNYPGWGAPNGKGCGTIYKLDPEGSFTVLHTFTGPKEGSYPLGLIIDSAGDLYGIAESGGDVIKHSNYEYGLGTIFKVDSKGKFSVLFTFTPEITLNHVYASYLAIDSQGNLYGMQEANNCALGAGCLFMIDTQGNYTDLYNFDDAQTGGGAFIPGITPGLLVSSDGTIFGTTPVGGNSNGEGTCTSGCGTAYQLVLSPDASRGSVLDKDPR